MSIIKHKAQRVAVLLDVQNMYHSAKNLYNARVNFKEVLRSAVAERELVRAIGYVIRTESGEEKSFLEALVKIGIETKLKDLQIFPGGMKKADWDVGMAVDAIRFAQNGSVNAIVLVTGDGDFIPLVEHLKSNTGTQVEVVAFGKNTSLKLKDAANDFLDLCDNPERYLLRANPRRIYAKKTV